MTCRGCGHATVVRFLDLGTAPPSNAYVTEENLTRSEIYVPLRIGVCTSCWLAQTEDHLLEGDLFTEDYAYFSSMSESWLEHSHAYVDDVAERLGLSGESLVIEVAANDGYLLRFVQEKGIPCIGIEPTASTAAAARRLGLQIIEEFLSPETAKSITEEFGTADLVVANNVFAHVPDITGFAQGLRKLVKPHGVITLEFPSLEHLITQGLFDTVYHEHYSYLTLHSATHVLASAGLEVFDVQELSTHGGSLRLFAQPCESGVHEISRSVEEITQREKQAGVQALDWYRHLQSAAEKVKLELLDFLIDQKRQGRVVAGYGAAAKGNTLLNYCGIRDDLLAFVVDRSPGKVGKYLPGSRIPVLPVEALAEQRPDSILILPWNIAGEVVTQLGCQMDSLPDIYVAVPGLRQVGL